MKAAMITPLLALLFIFVMAYRLDRDRKEQVRNKYNFFEAYGPYPEPPPEPKCKRWKTFVGASFATAMSLRMVPDVGYKHLECVDWEDK